MAEFASKGVAGTGLGLGIAGTALGLLNGGANALLGGGLSRVANCGGCAGSDAIVNRYEMNLVQEIAAKDAHIGLLEADKYTDQKIVEVYKDLAGQIGALNDKIQANRDEQNAINCQQAVYNGTMNAAISCIQGQIAQLQSLTKLVVPNASVCPGWGNVTITPAASTTTPTA